jgi:hypothetical protein
VVPNKPQKFFIKFLPVCYHLLNMGATPGASWVLTFPGIHQIVANFGTAWTADKLGLDWLLVASKTLDDGMRNKRRRGGGG